MAAARKWREASSPVPFSGNKVDEEEELGGGDGEEEEENEEEEDV